MNAFISAQFTTALRTRYGPSWPLFEFWKNRVQPHREVINKFVDPIIDDALAKREYLAGEHVEEKPASGGNTLLDNLVSQTQGSIFDLPPRTLAHLLFLMQIVKF